jgi:hypothetical protein
MWAGRFKRLFPFLLLLFACGRERINKREDVKSGRRKVMRAVSDAKERFDEVLVSYGRSYLKKVRIERDIKNLKKEIANNKKRLFMRGEPMRACQNLASRLKRFRCVAPLPLFMLDFTSEFETERLYLGHLIVMDDRYRKKFVSKDFCGINLSRNPVTIKAVNDTEVVSWFSLYSGGSKEFQSHFYLHGEYLVAGVYSNGFVLLYRISYEKSGSHIESLWLYEMGSHTVRTFDVIKKDGPFTFASIHKGGESVVIISKQRLRWFSPKEGRFGSISLDASHLMNGFKEENVFFSVEKFMFKWSSPTSGIIATPKEKKSYSWK